MLADLLAPLVLVTELTLGRVARPTAFVTPFSESTVCIAGPWSKKSTSRKFGTLPYADLHADAAAPSCPTAVPGPFVDAMAPMLGTWIPKASSLSRKWFTSDIKLRDCAEETLPETLVGRFGVQVKFEGEVLSKGFSKMKVNSSMRYELVESMEVMSREATKVKRRVLALMSVWRVGQVDGALDTEGGV